MTTSSHMFIVRGTAFGVLCTAPLFHPFLFPLWVSWQCSMFNPPLSPLLFLFPAFHLHQRVTHVCVCVCVCVCDVKGACAVAASSKQQAASSSSSTKAGPCVEMRPLGWDVLSLPTSPAGSLGWRWLVALCLQTDGNGQRRRAKGREEKNGEMAG